MFAERKKTKRRRNKIKMIWQQRKVEERLTKRRRKKTSERKRAQGMKERRKETKMRTGYKRGDKERLEGGTVGELN